VILNLWSLLELDPPSPGERRAASVDASNDELANVVQMHGPMPADLREMVNAFYAPFNIELAGLLDNPGFAWDPLSAAVTHHRSTESRLIYATSPLTSLVQSSTPFI